MPRAGSNLPTARMRPALPSRMRSSKGTPRPRYFLAMEMTSLRFDSMSPLQEHRHRLVLGGGLVDLLLEEPVRTWVRLILALS